MVKTITEHINDCCGCPPEMGCMGQACPYHPHDAEREVLVCDDCEQETEELVCLPCYDSDLWLCEDCMDTLVDGLLLRKKGEALT